jgi:hypothetical protein
MCFVRKEEFQKMLLSHGFIGIFTLFFLVLRLFVDRFSIVHKLSCFLDFIFDIFGSSHLLVKYSLFCLFEVLLFESLTFWFQIRKTETCFSEFRINSCLKQLVRSIISRLTKIEK